MTVVEKIVEKFAVSIGSCQSSNVACLSEETVWETIFGVFVESLAASGESLDVDEPAKLGGTTLRLIVENLH